jgi:methionine synthase I (cobalamin-dependent)
MTANKNPLFNLLESGRRFFGWRHGHHAARAGMQLRELFRRAQPDQPALVARNVHREYIEAGSQIIQTNTFGANRYKLARTGWKTGRADQPAGVELARRVVLASFKPVLIAGDVGPLGVRLAPVWPGAARAGPRAFSEQITALVRPGSTFDHRDHERPVRDARRSTPQPRFVTCRWSPR